MYSTRRTSLFSFKCMLDDKEFKFICILDEKGRWVGSTDFFLARTQRQLMTYERCQESNIKKKKKMIVEY